MKKNTLYKEYLNVKPYLGLDLIDPQSSLFYLTEYKFLWIKIRVHNESEREQETKKHDGQHRYSESEQ